MEASQTIAMAQKARELKNQGIDVVSLSLGEPDFDTPDFIKEGMKKAIDDNFSHYTPVPGYLSAREVIVKKLKRDNQLDFSPSQIVMSTGAKQCLAEIMLSILNPGDEVILPAPYWVSYKQMVELAEGTAKEIPTAVENHYKITPKQLEEAIGPKTKAFLFSSPSNPSGMLYTKDELKALAKVFEKHPEILIISDEIYELITFDGKHESIAQFENIKERVCIVNGLSKGFAMTGYRLGYIAAPQWLASAVSKMQSQITSGTCSIAQKAVETALAESPEKVSYMRDTFLNRRDFMHGELSKLKGFKMPLPQGAFYLFPDISYYFGKKHQGETIKNASDFAQKLLEDKFVATVSGDAFGTPNCLRLSYATSEENLKKAAERIIDFVNNLED
jgi:aspartate aminotransferase